MDNSITNLEAVNKVIMFGFNYPSGFIASVWGANTSMANHLQGKFNMNYERFGSNGVFSNFYVNLSSNNQAILISWIMANYKG
jgi:hypothetical protein